MWLDKKKHNGRTSLSNRARAAAPAKEAKARSRLTLVVLLAAPLSNDIMRMNTAMRETLAACLLVLAALSTVPSFVVAAEVDSLANSDVYLLGRITATYTMVLGDSSQGGAENDRLVPPFLV